MGKIKYNSDAERKAARLAARKRYEAKYPAKMKAFRRASKEKLGKKYFRDYERERRKLKPDEYRGYKLKQIFSITLEQYNHMLVSQGGVCACCGEPERYKKKSSDPAVKNLAVDHDHTTDAIRELLCSTCNRILGMIFERPWHADKLAAYLRKWGK